MTTNPVLQDSAIAHFASKLAFETDPSDVRADFDNNAFFVLIDSRGEASWRQGRITGAHHMPTSSIATQALGNFPIDTPVVVYCWGPGCNGSTRAALAFATLGYQVKEMIGGYEYWAREGCPTENDRGPIVRAKDALTAPLNEITCDC